MKKWVPVPVSWVNSIKYRQLKPNSRLLLFLLWFRTADGSVPKDPKEAQILAGVTDRPKRVESALAELEQAGFLINEGGLFFLDQHREIFARFGTKYRHKNAKFRQKKTEKTKSSEEDSRMRSLSPIEIKKDNEEKRTNSPEGCSSFSSELDPRVIDMMKGGK